MSYGTVNADVIGTSVANASLGAGNSSIMKNRIINGAMVVNQRGGTVTAAVTGTFGVDRFVNFANGGGVFTAVQSSTVPTGAGFVNSNLLTVTTADSSIGSTDYYSYAQNIEGYNIADLQWGTASAKTVTVSFWVNSSVTGLYALALINSNGSRCYPATFTITTANTWQYVTLTITGCTDGTWETTNGTGLVFRLDLGSGSANNGTANTWNTAGGFVGCRTASTVNWIATNGATLYITGVQLEVGTSATGYEYRQYQQELALCQRYAYKRLADGTINDYAPLGTGRYFGTNQAQLYVPFPVTMRSSPSSITVSGTILVNDTTFGGATWTSPVLNETSCDGATVTGSTTTGTTAGYATTFYVTASGIAYIIFSAEIS